MKKVLLAVVAVAFAFCMASCDKQCDCKTTITDNNGNKDVTNTTVDLTKLYGENTNKKCSDLNSTTELLGVKTVVKCH